MKKHIIVTNNLGEIQTIISAPAEIEFDKDSIICIDNSTNLPIPVVAMDADELDESDVLEMKRDLKKFRIKSPIKGKVVDKKSLEMRR